MLSFILITTLLLGSFVINTGAASNEKLSVPLVKTLSGLTNSDKLHVWVMLKKLNLKDDYTLEKIAYEACGFVYGDNLSVEQKQQVRNKKIQLMHEDRHQAVKELLSRMGVEYDNIVSGWNEDDIYQGWEPEFYLSKAKILEIVNIDEIDTIDLCYDDYYLVGTMNDWKIDQTYRLYNRGEGTLEISQIAISENDVFKIVKSTDGATYSEANSYPSEGNYNDDGKLITHESQYYYLSFCPTGGKEGVYWHDGAIYLEDLVPPYENTDTPDIYNMLCTYLNEQTNGRYSAPEYYEVLYTHFSPLGEADWVLLYTYVDAPDPWYGMGIISNRVIVSGTFPLFTFGMALYDTQKKAFYDLYKMWDYVEYDGLAKAIDKYGKGKLLGDIDCDDSISIIDATIIQRCLAGLCDYPESDWIKESDVVNDFFKPIHYYSDFNRNGERDILDATAIQRHLAGLS